MKFILILLFSIQGFASPAQDPASDETLSTVEYLSGSGFGSGFCRGDVFSDFCVRQIKDRAESDAKRDVEFQCRMKQGQLSFYGNCSTFCSPSFLTPGRDEFVNCNARCTYTCEIRKPTADQ